MKKETHHPILQQAIQLLQNDHEQDFVMKQLIYEGAEEAQALEIIKMAKKVLADRRFKIGMICVGVGSVLLLFSFLLALLSSYSDVFFVWSLYGLTAIGGILVFVGLIYVLG